MKFMYFILHPIYFYLESIMEKITSWKKPLLEIMLLSKPGRQTRPETWYLGNKNIHCCIFIKAINATTLFIGKSLKYNFNVYRKTAMNFNPPMCRAGKICIAEVEEVVDIDEIPPGQVNCMELPYLISTLL